MILSGDPAQPSGVWGKRSCSPNGHSATSALGLFLEQYLVLLCPQQEGQLETEVAGSPSSEPKEKRWRSLNSHPESLGSLGWACGPRWTLRRSRCRPVVSELLVASGGPARGGWAGDAHFGMEPLVRSRCSSGQGQLFHGVSQAWGVKVRPLISPLPTPPPRPARALAWLEDVVQTAC